jgi:hypothetical protein
MIYLFILPLCRRQKTHFAVSVDANAAVLLRIVYSVVFRPLPCRWPAVPAARLKRGRMLERCS